MAFSHEQLEAGVDLTSDDTEEELLGVIQDLGIQTTDWSTGAPETLQLKLGAYMYAKLIQRIGQATKNQTLATSSGSALTAFSDSWYDNQRIEAGKAQGTMVVTGSGGVVPITFAAGELKITDGNFIFLNTGSFTLSHAVPFVSATVIAEDVGAEYNIANDASLSFVGTLNGVTVTNPAPEGETTWLTTLGVDEESDATLRARNRTKWSTFEIGYPTIDRVEQIALSASSDITHVSIDDQNPRGEFTVDVYLAQATETATAAQVTVIQDAMDSAFFGNAVSGYTTLVTCSAAVEREFDQSFTVVYSPIVNATTIIAAVSDTCDAFVESIPIGGKSYAPITGSAASLYDLVREIDSLEGVQTISGTMGTAGFLALNKNQKLTSPADWTEVITFVQGTSS